MRFELSALLLILTLLPLARANDDRSDKNLTDMSLEQLMSVRISAASLHDQRPEDAPASVTVITAEQIRQQGSRTLAEALTYARGIYFNSDYSYNYVGLRGLLVPGDYMQRILVLVNGHTMTENLYDSAGWFGEDFPVDISLVERIEIIRGPSSAIYGTNGMLATFNVVTRRPDQVRDTSVRIETGSIGERKLQVSSALPVGRDGHLLVSASVLNNVGSDTLYFEFFDQPETNFGRARRMDGEKGYHAFADFSLGNWELMASLGNRIKVQPVSWGPTIFNDPGTAVQDVRAFVDLAYTRQFEHDRELRWRAYYDAYRYRGTYHYLLDDQVTDSREDDAGDWLGTQISFRQPMTPRGHLTVGAELKVDVRARQYVFDQQPRKELLELNRPDRFAGVFAQQEWALSRRWSATVGGRIDVSAARKGSISPRAALIYQPSQRTTFKLLYGRGFRNPSAYEMFYDDGGRTSEANRSLRPESSDTVELVAERSIGTHFRGLVSAYRYAVRELIVVNYIHDGLQQYQNQGSVSGSGIEAEISGTVKSRLELLTSLSVGRTSLHGSGSLPNSPGQVGKFRASAPFWSGRLGAMTGVVYNGERRTIGGNRLPGFVLSELALNTRRLWENVELTLGAKNLANSYYRDPVALVDNLDSVARRGRTYFFNVLWRGSR